MALAAVQVPNNIAGIVARRFLTRCLADEGNRIAGISFSTLPLDGPPPPRPSPPTAAVPATRPVTAATIDADASMPRPGIFETVAGYPVHVPCARPGNGDPARRRRHQRHHAATASSLGKDVVRLQSLLARSDAVSDARWLALLARSTPRRSSSLARVGRCGFAGAEASASR
jgi:hypothetical protein